MTETRSGARPVVVIRADASIQIGSGPVLRGPTLADRRDRCLEPR